MKLLIGGSPCTHWSIAQTKHRETTAEGIGWELFKNYLIAREKYKPDYFLYENNKSMASAIREQITKELGVEPVLINSALVSAQNRQRLYWVGRRNADGTYSQVPIEQPEDRSILVRDILETTTGEKGYALRAECINGLSSGKARTVDAHMGKLENCLVPRMNDPNPAKQQYDCIAEPVRIGTIENAAKNPDHDSQQYRVYSPDGKGVTLCGNGGGLGAKTGLYATPVRVGDMPNAEGVIRGGQTHRIYDSDGKAVTLTARPNGGGVDGPLYATPCCMRYERTEEAKRVRKQYEAHEVHHGFHELSELHPRTDGKSNTLSTVLKDNPICERVLERDESGKWAICGADGKKYPVYEVRNGQISVKGKEYPIKLKDGFYIIRKLTVTECKRLQTVPDEFMFPVSDSQAYKMLGNGWTVDVIAHIMSHFEGLTAKPVEVLSMYDGMSCGHIALDKLGVEVSAYYATEIDKYAIQATQHNFPDTVQLGDAFQVREEGWRLLGRRQA